MYFAAQFINVKLNQDYADSFPSDDLNALVICDGIGEFEQSGEASKLVSEYFGKDVFHKRIDEIIKEAQIKLLEKKIVGGTTFISVIQQSDSSIDLHYLGNGGVIHFNGDYANNPYSSQPYRFTDIMLPHISPNGALTRHISHNSGINELTPSSLSLTLNNSNGDIIILYSDGIGSLEEKAIIKDEENRFWRHENQSIQIILNRLHLFLQIEHLNFSFYLLNDFLIDTLKFLKNEGLLDDDASIGIVLTEGVITYYSTLANDQGIK